MAELKTIESIYKLMLITTKLFFIIYTKGEKDCYIKIFLRVHL